MNLNPLFVKRIQFFLTTRWISVIIVTGATFGLYYETWSFGFTNWDDTPFVRDNPFLRSFSRFNLYHLLLPGSIPGELLYIPITYFSYLVESTIVGINPFIFHLTNTIIHAGNAILVFYIVRRWSENWYTQTIVSLLFAVHPLQAEAVSWIMGRKDLLSTFFSLATIIVYQKLFESGNRRYYLLVIFGFVCAILSKPTVIILPAVLILLAVFRRYRLKLTDWSCLLMMVCLSAAVYWVNHTTTVGAQSQSVLSLEQILLNGVYIPYVVSGWIMRLFLLSPVEVFYSSSSLLSAENLTTLPFISLLFIVYILVWSLKQHVTAIWFGILFAVIAILPSLSLVIFLNREFFTADRYGYFSLIPIFFCIAYPLQYCSSRLFMRIYISALLLWVVLCMRDTSSVISVWRNSETLWRFVLSHDPVNSVAHNLLGNYYYKKGRFGDAVRAYYQAVRDRPNYANGHYNLGRVYSDLKRYDLAIKYYQRALDAKPDYVDAYYNLGIVYLNSGFEEKALSTFKYITKFDPKYVEANYCIGLIHKRRENFNGALSAFDRLLTLAPDHAKACFQSAIILHKTGRIPQAIVRYRRSLRHDPSNYKAYYNLALIYWKSGQYDKSISSLLAAKEINPTDPEIRSQLQKVLLEKKSMTERSTRYLKHSP